jgi:hypothetical protein
MAPAVLEFPESKHHAHSYHENHTTMA